MNRLLSGRAVSGSILFLLLVGTLSSALSMNHFARDVRVEAEVQNDDVILDTTMGSITIEPFGDMPITTANFENLTQHGFYDGTIFHRVIHGFVIQGGDITSKGITVPTIPDELPNKHSNVRGSVGMARTIQPNSATSQFYINLQNNSYLDANYVVFGQVVEGMDVVDSIGNVPTDSNDHPLQNVTILGAHASAVPVGGYSFQLQVPTKTEPLLLYVTLIGALMVVLTKLKPVTNRKP